MTDFQLQRLGLVMEPEPGNPLEAEGVLNPAAVRGPDGQLYLFPRLVARGNYSRIGIARVRFNEAGDPAGVERLGIALEPEADYELRPDGSGGCEDPRITFVEPLQRYVMTYTALSPNGPRIALAVSEICSTGSAWGWLPSGPIRASSSTAWTTRTPASSLSPFQIHRDSRHWPSCTGRCFPELVRRKRRATLRPAWWISIAKASGFPIAQRPWRTVSRFTSAILARITGWPLRWHHGNGSKSAAVLHPILTRHGWLIVYHGVSELCGADPR